MAPRPKWTVDRADQLQALVDDYFKDPKSVKSICGLALHLGLASRQSLTENAERKDIIGTIVKNAKLQIERHYEVLGQTARNGFAIFVLKNMGWSDQSQVDHSGDITVKVKITGGDSKIDV